MKLEGLSTFLCGALLATTVTVMATGKPAAAQSGQWSVQIVDEGPIRFAASANNPLTTNQVTKSEADTRLKELEGNGWEPFAASTYSDQITSNEHVYYFRKRS